MKTISSEVGKKIKYYRKKRNFSVEQLATMIYKGKSTIYKYENGSIPIDVETLKEIADALDVPVSCFLETSFSAPNLSADCKLPFGDHDSLYLYCYINHSLIKSKMVISYNKERCNMEVTFYYHVTSFSDYKDCEYIYQGEILSFDFITYFLLVNTLSNAEHVNICVFNPWKQEQHTWGLLFGLLNFPLAPAVSKILLTTEVLEKNHPLLSELVLTKEDFRKMRNSNLFYLIQNRAETP